MLKKLLFGAGLAYLYRKFRGGSRTTGDYDYNRRSRRGGWGL